MGVARGSFYATVKIAAMRLTEFHRLIDAEFGEAQGGWIIDSHVLAEYGKTAHELIEQGVEPRKVWWALCADFKIPEERQLGPDIEGF